jgi:hypothetical protein
MSFSSVKSHRTRLSRTSGGKTGPAKSSEVKHRMRGEDKIRGKGQEPNCL